MVIQAESAGVDFSSPATPGELPGANNAVPQFNTTNQLSADSNPPAAPNGINAAGEFLTLRFTIGGAFTFNDIISALNQGVGVDALRIGAHVQAIGTSGQSDGVICCGGSGGGSGTGQVVPEPASLALFGLVALGAASRVRRRNRQ
jgi:hypothetical protein